MSSIMDYVNELKKQRDMLVDILSEKGVSASKDETFNSLISKINDVSGSSNQTFDMTGIFGLFTADSIDISSNLWRNELSGYNDIALTGGSKNGAALRLDVNDYGSFTCIEPNTVYSVVKTPYSTSCNHIITKALNTLNGSENYGFNLLQLNGFLYFSAAGNDTSNTSVSCTDYHVYCYTRNGTNGYFYIDGNFIGTISNCRTGKYSNLMYLNNESWGGVKLGTSTICDFLMCAFGLTYHDESIVQKNTAYLMQKYGLTTTND